MTRLPPACQQEDKRKVEYASPAAGQEDFVVLLGAVGVPLTIAAVLEQAVFAAGRRLPGGFGQQTVLGTLADEQLARRKRGDPQTHRLVRLEPSSKRSARILGPVDGFLVDG